MRLAPRWAGVYAPPAAPAWSCSNTRRPGRAPAAADSLADDLWSTETVVGVTSLDAGLDAAQFHALEREDPALRVELELSGGTLSFAPRDPRALCTTATLRTGTARSCTAQSALAASTATRTWCRPGRPAGRSIWPWLIGPFVDAWLALHGSEPARLRQAHARFVQPLLDQLAAAGLGHVSEVADGDAPHTPGGCPFQAATVGELSRIVALEHRPAPPV